MTTPVLVALALAAATPAEARGDERPATLRASAPGPAPAVEASAVPAADHGHTGWRHDVDLGAQSTHLSSDEGAQYAFYSATIGYTVSYGVTGPFLRLGLLAPLQATQDGTRYATANYYSRRAGADFLAGVQHRWTVRSAELEAGPGFHATLIDLPGRAGYRDFSALPLGVGVSAALRWRTGQAQLSRAVTVGTTASIGYDFGDPAHANDLAHGLTFRVAVALGLGARR